jgi:hypothetical protein
LKPVHGLEAKQILQNAKVEYGHGGEEMVDDVVIGDNIAMLCQSSIDESIWIMLIDNLPIWSKNIS